MTSSAVCVGMLGATCADAAAHGRWVGSVLQLLLK